MPSHYGERKSREAFKDTSPKRKYVATTDEDDGEGGVVNPKTGKKEWKLAKKAVNDVNS